MRLTRTAALPIAVASLLALTACSGGDADAPEDSASPTATEEPTPEETADDDAAVASGGAGCLEGTWEVDQSTISETMLSAPGIEELNPEIEVSGSASVSFDGASMTTVYEDQLSSVTITMNGAPVTTTTSLDGTVVASYTATDTDITVADVDMSGVTVRSTSVVDGQETEIPGLDSAEAAGVPLGGVSTFECTDDELRLTPQIEGVDTSGFVQVMKRRG